MNGFSLLVTVGGWAFGITVLYLCWRVAIWLDQRTPIDEWCSDIDTSVDMQDAHDARMRREARV